MSLLLVFQERSADKEGGGAEPKKRKESPDTGSKDSEVKVLSMWL